MRRIALVVLTALACSSNSNAQTDINGSRNLLGSIRVRYANAGSTGTTVNKLAKLTGAPSTAVITATSDISGAVGLVTSAGGGTTGNADIAITGKASCVFDGATTAGHYVQISSSVAGDCHDAGATFPTSGQIIGVVTSTNGSGGTYEVDLTLRHDAVKTLRSFGATFDGGGSALAGSVTRCTSKIPYGGTIQEVAIDADVAGSGTIDIKTVAFASYTGVASTTSIVNGGTTPALATAIKYSDSTLTSFTTTLAASSVACFLLTSPATSTVITISVTVLVN